MAGDDAARARLATAFAACELSDLARALVPIGEDELRPDGAVLAGTLLADAVHVLAAARRLVEAAVVFERAAGADWSRVADVLGVSPAQAQDRFAGAEGRFRDRLRSPGEDAGSGAAGGTGWWRAHLAREPLEAAQDLDDWVLRHPDGGDGLGAAPVSGALERTLTPSARPPRTRRR